MKQNIALVGSMKNVNNQVGKILADSLEMYYLDTDAYIEYQVGLTCGKIVEDYGYKYFYDLEKQHLDEIKDFENAVIATSGSFLMIRNNINILKEEAYIVLLTADEDVQEERIKKDRNLAVRKDLLKNFTYIQETREGFIERVADIIIDTTNLAPAQVAKKIKDKLMIILGTSNG